MFIHRTAFSTTLATLLLLSFKAYTVQCFTLHCNNQSSRRYAFSNHRTSVENASSSSNNEHVSDKAADELKSILLSNQKMQQENKDRIENLIQTLTESKIQFDPIKCINGPLYAVLYQSGPIPFWEKYDFKFLKNNIKGQRYRSISKESSSFDIVNYAEFWGDNLSIQGCGTCTLMEKTNDDKTFTGSGSLLLTCPVDYEVKIQSASASIFKKKFQLNVEGTGYTRILYANEELRIILAPKDTTDERWMEKAGLVVVQVRSDLVDPNFVLLD
jgi:hypothetical protein